jgi:hypothetical protein
MPGRGPNRHAERPETKSEEALEMRTLVDVILEDPEIGLALKRLLGCVHQGFIQI